ncbi:hypothetical protein INR49_027008 [Caranx melampygus]|nr:hypothetical protein INR49_027008 [Caranx melampygus]
MGTCRAMSSSSSVSRSGYVSWCMDSESPTPVPTAPTPASEQSSHPNHQSSGPGSVPLLLLSPPETCGGETTRPRRQIQHKASIRDRPSWLNTHYNADQATNSRSDEGEDDDARGCDSRCQEEVQRLLLLPRGSPVISRHQSRPISWHGEEPVTSDASSSDSPSPAAESQDQRGPDLESKPGSSQHHSSPVQEEKKQRSASTSSNLNHFLTSLFHLPFGGQQGLADERKGRRPSSCDASHTPDCGVDTTLTLKDSLTNAERLAQQLVLEFKRTWLPSHEPQRGRLSLRSSLQELPGTGSVAVSGDSLTEEIRLRTRMRGSLSWAPPRFQIIFTVQPTLRRSEVVALQHFLCAGCGTEVEPRYIKKLRYCEYLGRYFCDCCHSGSEAVIPGRVLSCWDFSRYPVSDFSKQLLDSELHEQLLCIIKLLKACRLSGSVMTELEQLPGHLIFQQPPLFSMDDLLKVKKGQLVAQARALLHAAISHVESCQICLARGFICEFCRDRDIIFPFQSDICRRCPGDLQGLLSPTLLRGEEVPEMCSDTVTEKTCGWIEDGRQLSGYSSTS